MEKLDEFAMIKIFAMCILSSKTHEGESAFSFFYSSRQKSLHEAIVHFIRPARIIAQDSCLYKARIGNRDND